MPSLTSQQAPPQQPQGQAAGSTGRRFGVGFFALLAVVVLVVGVGLGWGITRLTSGGGDGVVAAPTVPPPAPSGGSDDEPEQDGTGEESSGAQSPGPQATDGGSELPDDPDQALEQIADDDEGEVGSDIEGTWVAQISSKKPGMEIDGKTWSEEDILADHQELREQFPRARLLWSGDYGSFKDGSFWITIIANGYSDPEDALDWCRSNGLGADDCYAKKITRGGSHEDTTRLQ